MTTARRSAFGRTTGPAPDPNSLRSAKRGAEWVRIPRNARDGAEIPDWPPYVSEPTDEELAMWIDLWRKPQSVLWLRDEISNQVAMYCRLYISSMREGGFATEKVAAERMAGSLLLTVPALLSAKILIVDPEPEGESTEITQPGSVTPISTGGSVRSRFTVVIPSEDDVTEDENESVTSDD